MTLRLLTAGESHGERLTVILDGVPAGLTVREEDLAGDLQRRQGGHGRGGRMAIEHDEAHIVAGVRGGLTLGSPITLEIANRDWENWRQVMAIDAAEVKRKPITRVRPGHADLAGMLKYGADDARDVLERASARETAARVAAGGVAKLLLAEFGVHVRSYTRSIGAIEAALPTTVPWEAVESSAVRCPDGEASQTMIAAIDAARERRDTLGGVSTLLKPLATVDLKTKEPARAHYERSDICVVPAAGVVGEAMVALVLAGVLLEKFGSDSMAELRRNVEGYLQETRR